MTDETIDKLFSALDETFKPWGYDRFDEAQARVTNFFRMLVDATSMMQDRGAVRDWLRSIPEPEPGELEPAIQLLSGLGYTVRQFAPKVVKSMPHLPGGHPSATTTEEQRKICAEIDRLYTDGGLRREFIYKRIAKKYSVSTRTIQRIWKEREMD